MIKRIIIILASLTVFISILYNWTPWCFNQTGKIYLNKKNYVKASNCFKNALALKKDNKEYRYNYVKTLSELSPDLNVQKEIFKIANDNTNDSAQKLAADTVVKW